MQMLHLPDYIWRKPTYHWILIQVQCPAELCYSAPKQECLDIVCSLKAPAPYLFYKTFNILKDHTALLRLLIVQQPSGCLVWWRPYFVQRNFKAMYKKVLRDGHAGVYSGIFTMAKTVADDWNEITFLLAEDNFLELTDELPLQQCFKYAHKAIKLQQFLSRCWHRHKTRWHGCRKTLRNVTSAETCKCMSQLISDRNMNVTQIHKCSIHIYTPTS